MFRLNAASVKSRRTYDNYLEPAAANRRLLLIAREALFKDYQLDLIIKAAGRFVDHWRKIGRTSGHWNLHGPLTRYTIVDLEDCLTDHRDQLQHRLPGQLRAVIRPDGVRRQSKPLIGPLLAASMRLKMTRRLRVTVSALFSEDDAADAVEALGNVVVVMQSLREIDVIMQHEAEDVDATIVARMLLRIMRKHNGGRETKISITRHSVLVRAMRAGTMQQSGQSLRQL